MPDRPQSPARQSRGFLWLYALASAGGAIAYVPFLTILFPARLEMLAQGDHVRWLAIITFCGALSASIGGILFGWLSDFGRNRRPWIAAGLAGTTVLLVAFPIAHSPFELLAMVVLWQLLLNMMLSPLAAWAADHVPPAQLGSLGGLLSFSPALGALSGALVTAPRAMSPDARLWFVAALVLIAVLPALLMARPRSGLEIEPPKQDRATPSVTRGMWIARFLVQIAEAALFAYLYYYLRSIDASFDSAAVARVSGIVVAISVPAALIVGRWSDRRARPILPLTSAALLSAAALVAMALAGTPTQAIVGYVLFGMTTTVFLSLHSAQTFRVLRHSGRRGRDLGTFNLTNTTPSLIMPWLTILLVPTVGYPGLFLCLALLAVAAAGVLALVAARLGSA